MRMVRDSDETEARRIADSYLSPLYRAYEHLIGQGVAAGVFRPIDPQMFYFTLTGAVDRFFSARLVLRHCFGQDTLTEDLRDRYREHTIDIIMAGILRAAANAGGRRRNDGSDPGTWHIGVIGGSGLAGGIALEEAQEIEVASAFGQPSGPVRTGLLAGQRFTFIARHGAGHAIPPGQVNYRANIDVLKRCGVTDVLALSAIGSLREEMAPGHFRRGRPVHRPHPGPRKQLFRTRRGRPREPCRSGLSAAGGSCRRSSARSAGAQSTMRGCYVAIEGPQFSTRAESRMYRAWGGDVIGMTAMPEARLAREAELPYALLGMVTDWDCWRDGEAGVEAAQILAVIAANVALAHETVHALAARFTRTTRGQPDRSRARPRDHHRSGAYGLRNCWRSSAQLRVAF